MMNGFSGGMCLLKTNISKHKNMNSKHEFVIKIMTRHGKRAGIPKIALLQNILINNSIYIHYSWKFKNKSLSHLKINEPSRITTL